MVIICLAPFFRRSRHLLSCGAKRFDLDVDFDLLSDEDTAGLERHIPMQAEVLAVDGRRGAEAGAVAAPRILGASEALDLQLYGPRDPVDREIARDHEVVAITLDAGA